MPKPSGENQQYRVGCIGGRMGYRGRRKESGRSQSGYSQTGKELEYHAGESGLHPAETESQGKKNKSRCMD